MIAGSGRCNITHSGSISDFFGHYGENSRFLRTALHSFTNKDLVDFFTTRGLHTIEDKNGKIFPYTERSADVLDVLLSECVSRKVKISTNERVLEVSRQANGFQVVTESKKYSSSQLVIATGGLSYPSTGSSGDGYRISESMGHSIVAPCPALSPVFIRDYSMAELAGVSLQNKVISLFRNNKKINEHSGDIGFTHKGLSGPGILDFSRFMNANDELRVNFLDWNTDEFRESIIEAAEKSGKMAIQTYMKQFDLPRSLVKIILSGLSIPPELTLATLTKEKRNQVVRAFCEFPFVIEKVGGYSMAMATHGGVSIADVSSKTMESKMQPGLYFAGEVLDLDGDTGGYNLQAAFSTGFLVAESINKIEKKPGRTNLNFRV